jgi:hypothetical protein
MAITFARRPGAIRSTSNPPTFEEEWVCEGIFDSGVVKASAVNLTPLVVAVEEGLLYRNNIQVEEQGYGLYYVGVTYGEKKNEVGAYRFSGSTTGGTLHITHSRETVGKYPDTARGHNQAIDLGKDNVPRGTDRGRPGAQALVQLPPPGRRSERGIRPQPGADHGELQRGHLARL